MERLKNVDNDSVEENLRFRWTSAAEEINEVQRSRGHVIKSFSGEESPVMTVEEQVGIIALHCSPQETSYHSLHITTERIPRTALFNLPFNLMVVCHRTCGWELRDTELDTPIAGEYEENWLVLDVGGKIIIDSRKHL